MDLTFAAAGAVTGLLIGLTGVGGGALMTPLLLVVFGVAPLTAVGTDLWFAALTKLAAVRIHHRHALIEWPVVRRLWTGSLPAAAAALLFVSVWPLDAHAGRLLTAGIAAAVMLSALGMLGHDWLASLGRSTELTSAPRFRAWQALLTVAAGAGLGVMVSLTSVGAGAVGAVVLAYLYPLRLTPPRLVATDIVHAIPLAVFAGVGHLLLGSVDFTLLANLLLGSVPAALIGARLSARLPHRVTRVVLAAVLLVVSGKLLWALFA
jgi:hypothetical protein